MKHLVIKQNTGSTELVSGSIIEKLYNITKDILDYKAEHPNDSDDYSVELEGTLNANITYLDYIDYLAPTTGTKKFPNLYITATNIALRFTDPEVLRVLLANDVGSNGTILGTDAAALTDIYTTDGAVNWFLGNTTIVTLNDLNNFPNLHLIRSAAFKDCTSLTNVNLSNITTINANAFLNDTALLTVNLSGLTTMSGTLLFRGCTALTSANIGSVTAISNNAFNGCTNLTTIDLSNVTSIGNEAFNGCTSLTSINLSSCTSLGQAVFSGCTGLTTIDLSNCTTLRAQAFYGCTSLTNINSDLSLVTTLSYDKVFDNCPITGHIRLTQLTQSDSPENSFIRTKITSLTLGSAITSALGGLSDDGWSIPSSSNLIYLDYSHVRSIKINNSAWTSGNTSLKLIKLPSTITQIGNNIVGNCTSLEAIVLPATTPPTYSGENWQTNTPFLKNGNTLPNANLKIYVPKASLNTYKTDANWGKYSDILLSIEDDYTDPDYYATTNAWQNS